MEQIIQPATTTIRETETNGSFSVEPLFPGYGSTLGNALRRVLLSSLEGAAVDYVVIDGVQHEFSTIPNVKEDVVEILLNLKGLRFKLSTTSSELELNVTSAGVVTGAAFKSNADCEVVNKDHVIAHLSQGGKFNLRVGVKRGQGYEPVEKKVDREKVVGVITTDSIFSPVTSVSYKVENTRVGQMTNFDRLVIDIQTDGSLKPSEALQQAAQILTSQYQSISGAVVKEEKEMTTETDIEGHEELIVDDTSFSILHTLDPKTKIEDAGFSGRTAHALVSAGYKTLSGLKRLSDIKLQGIKGLGAKGVEEVHAILSRVE
jgi:DNA-directed RNA polymerase subunit alpha